MRRPPAITLIIILIAFDYALTFLASALGIFALAVPALQNFLRYTGMFIGPYLPPDNQIYIFATFFCALLSPLLFRWLRGLWQLKNWARLLLLFACFFNVLVASSAAICPNLIRYVTVLLAPKLWPTSHAVQSGLLPHILGTLISATVIAYLLSMPVRNSFAAKPTETKWLLAGIVLLVLYWGHALYKSGPEFTAMRWHARHCDQFTVNGVTFPIDYWFLPATNPPVDTTSAAGFSIRDESAGRIAPLATIRPTDTRTVSLIDIYGFRTPDNNLPAADLVDRDIAKRVSAGYPAPEKSQIQITHQPLECSKQTTTPPILLTCYGSGPIYAVSFIGDERGYSRFRTMLASAR